MKWLNRKPFAASLIVLIGVFIVVPKNFIPSTQAQSDSFYIQNHHYTYDPVGNITEIDDRSMLGTKKQTSYTYDDLNRLLSTQTLGFTQGDYTQTFQYDPIGNMTYKSNVGSMIYGGTGFPNPHAITEVAGRKYTYDKKGNVISDGEKTYTWNILNQLTSVTFPDGTVMEYTYNPFGQRLTSTNLKTGEKTIYVNKFMEIRPKSTIYYIWAGNQRVAQVEVPKGKNKEEGILTYLHEDHLGGTVVSTDEKGKVVQVYDYDPYGTQILSKSDSTIQVPYSFTGKEYEENTGLYYFGARYYDPKVGRFLSEDPVAMNSPEKILSDPQGLNTYAYARNNPLTYIDPNGEYFETAADFIAVTLSYLAFKADKSIINGAFLAADIAALVSPLPALAGYTRHGAKAVSISKYFTKVASSTGKSAFSIAKSFWDNINFSQTRLTWSSGRPGNSLANLVGHYEKHGESVKATSLDDYYNKANDFIANASYSHSWDENGYKVYYNNVTKYASYLSSKGEISSYYKITDEVKVQQYDTKVAALDATKTP